MLPFAVLLKGKWGCGKTYFIKEYINGKENFIHISLYGLSSFVEIKEKIIVEILPLIPDKYSRITTLLYKNLKRIPYIKEKIPDNTDDLILGLYLNKKNNGHIFIFDDLERCDIAIEKLLGYINHLVEFLEQKVIIIANEEAILKSGSGDKYSEIKEKLIGKEFSVNPNPEEAIGYFVNNIKNVKLYKKKDLIAELLLKLFYQSGYDNLRLIQQAISDFEYFFEIIESKVDEDSQFFEKIVYEFLAIFIEYKKGKIKSGDFDKWPFFFRGINDKENHFLDKYDGISNWIICYDVEVLGKVLQGISLNEEENKKLLEKIESILSNNQESWQILWNFRENDDSTFFKMLEDVMNKWRNREYIDFFVVAHVFGIFLYFAEQGFIQESKATILEQVKEYINNLIKDNNFPLDLGEERSGMGWWEGTYGLGYHGNDSSEWKEFMGFVKEKTKELRPKFIKEKIQNELLPILRGKVKSNENLDLLINYNFLHDSLGKGEAYFQYLEAGEIKDILIKNGISSLNRYKTIFIQRYTERKADIIGIEQENDFLVQLKGVLEEEIKKTKQLFGGRLTPKIFLINAFIDKALAPFIKINIKETNMNYKGVIIEESLENNDILKSINILSTKVESVVEKHKTPWLKQWTLHTVELPENQADNIAQEISKALDQEHSWYADFKNETTHFIIFRDKVFKIDRTSKEQYDKAKEYGISLGIPPYQVDFHPEVKEWEK